MGLIDSIMDELNIIEDAGGIEIVETVISESEESQQIDNENKKRLLDCLYEKSYECPVCDNAFKSLTVRNGKVRIKEMHMDLKPIYEPLPAEYYSIVLCEKCGYAAMESHFLKLFDFQIELFKKTNPPKFVKNCDDRIYTPEYALQRHKQAIQCSIIKKAKSSEIAYLALKSAWIYRDLKEDLYETTYLKMAYNAFNQAILNEYYPMCGLGEQTVLYILANLAYKLGNKDSAKKILSRIIGKTNVSANLKNKIEDLRELLK